METTGKYNEMLNRPVEAATLSKEVKADSDQPVSKMDPTIVIPEIKALIKKAIEKDQSQNSHHA